MRQSFLSFLTLVVLAASGSAAQGGSQEPSRAARESAQSRQDGPRECVQRRHGHEERRLGERARARDERPSERRIERRVERRLQRRGEERMERKLERHRLERRLGERGRERLRERRVELGKRGDERREGLERRRDGLEERLREVIRQRREH